MSDNVIRKLLEVHLNGTPSGLSASATAYENVAFQPTMGTPWQRAKLLPATSPNPTLGDGFRRDVGLFQVTFNYPVKAGAHPAGEAAQRVKDRFKRGTTLQDGVVRVMIDKAPFSSQGVEGGDWYQLAVTIPYIADIQG